MLNPIALIPSGWRRRLFWLFLSLTIILMIVFSVTGASMTTHSAPYGVVSFEIAGSVDQARAILDSWDGIARERAAFGLGLDYLFMPVYAFTIALGCSMAADGLKRHGWPLSSFGAPLVWLQFGAGLFDVVENIALSFILFGSITSPWPQIARWCAIPKFTFIFLGIVYALYGAVVVLISRLAPSRDK